MKVIRGTQGADFIASPQASIPVQALGGDDTVLGADRPGDSWYENDIYEQEVHLGPGDDVAVEWFTASDTIHGGQGDDTITTGEFGTWGGYDGGGYAFGEAGHDLLTGRGILSGGTGNDTLIGGGRMSGGWGNDTYECHIFTGDIVDTHGRSVITVDQEWVFSPAEFSDSGGTRIVTGDRKDSITVDYIWRADIDSGAGADFIDVYVRYSTIRAGRGNDTVHATVEYASDEVTVLGGPGRDSLRGGTFADGGQGHDVITSVEVRAEGGWGSDTVSGTVADGGIGKDRVEGWELGLGGDGDGDDWVTSRVIGRGGNDDDYIDGGGLLLGDNGNDTLEGNSLTRAPTDDTLEGGRGVDELRFSLYEGDDVLRGGGAGDTFVLSRFDPDDLPEFIDALDTIEGFQQGDDLIDVRLRAAEFADLTIAQAGDFVVVQDAVGYNLVAIAGAAAGDFDADDFIF